jgi:hypothetical protein
MTSSGGWRLTAVLGAVAFVLCAGITSWMIVTIADMQSGVHGLSVELAMPNEARPVTTQPNGVRAVARPNLLASDFGHDLSHDLGGDVASGSVAPFGAYAFEGDLGWLGKNAFTTAKSTIPTAFQPGTMPLPGTAPLAWSDPPDTQPTQAIPDPAAAPSEPPKRLAQEPRFERPRVAAIAPTAPAAKVHKLGARPYFMEKLVEQGDAGDITFRYRRRNCTPPHMVDVCYMPPENRRNIVVERW